MRACMRGPGHVRPCTTTYIAIIDRGEGQEQGQGQGRAGAAPHDGWRMWEYCPKHHFTHGNYI